MTTTNTRGSSIVALRASTLDIPEAALQSAVDGAAALTSRARDDAELVTLIGFAVAALKTSGFLVTQPAPEPAPEPGFEFGGLAHVVKVWCAGHRSQHSTIAAAFPALYNILNRASAYLDEVEAQQPINEASPATGAGDGDETTVNVLDRVMGDAGGISMLYTPRGFLNAAVHYAAQAVQPEAAMPPSELVDMFAYLASTATTVEQHEELKANA